MKKKSFYIIMLLSIMLSCTDKEKEANKYTNSALIKIENSDFNGAIKDISKSIELTPTNSKLYFLRGNTYFNLRQYQNAIADYNVAINLNEKFTDAYYNRGNTYLLLDNNEKACADFIVAFKLGKPNIEDKIKRCK